MPSPHIRLSRTPGPPSSGQPRVTRARVPISSLSQYICDCCCGCGVCSECQNFPCTWKVTVAGLRDQESCRDCERFNGTWTLKRYTFLPQEEGAAFNCQWANFTGAPAEGGPFVLLAYNATDNQWELSFNGASCGTLIYCLAGQDWLCCGPNTLTLSGGVNCGNPGCANAPASVTVVDAEAGTMAACTCGCCEGMPPDLWATFGTGTGPCSCLDGVGFPLRYVANLRPLEGVSAWLGSLVINTCGLPQQTFGVKLYCDRANGGITGLKLRHNQCTGPLYSSAELSPKPASACLPLDLAYHVELPACGNSGGLPCATELRITL